MSLDEFDGIKLSKSKLTYVGALLALALVGYNAIGDYNRRGYEIERLSERDAARKSEVLILTAKLDLQTQEITALKIAINRLADKLEVARNVE